MIKENLAAVLTDRLRRIDESTKLAHALKNFVASVQKGPTYYLSASTSEGLYAVYFSFPKLRSPRISGLTYPPKNLGRSGGATIHHPNSEQSLQVGYKILAAYMQDQSQ